MARWHRVAAPLRRDLSLNAVLHYIWYSVLSACVSWNLAVFIIVGVDPRTGAWFWPVGVALALPADLAMPLTLVLVWFMGAGFTYASNLLLLRQRHLLAAARKHCFARFAAGLVPVATLQVTAWLVLSKWGQVAQIDPRNMP
jgi:hypothetical protein